jgi:3-methyl-2-oxobutanoate hydroxymethyltransferase
MTTTEQPVRRLTISDIGRMYADGERIPMLTAYDFPTARILDEAGVQAVKIEGGRRSGRIIEALVKAGIAVQGHIGWTPQSQTGMGGKVRVQGKSRDAARALLADALAVQEAGAFSIVLELVPEQLAAEITARLKIPTIGIGAGAGCSGQVQVINDVIGLGTFTPRHARHYAEIGRAIGEAVRSWAADVQAGAFPGAAESVRMEDSVLDEALGRHADDRAAATEALIPLDRDL